MLIPKKNLFNKSHQKPLQKNNLVVEQVTKQLKLEINDGDF